MTKIMDNIKSDMYDMFLSTKFELRKHYRRSRIQMAVILSIFLASVFYIVPTIWNMGLADTAEGFASTNLGFVNLLIILSGALFAGDVISSEFENKTGLILFPTPQDHNSIFIGKYLASAIATFSVVTIYYGITALEIQYVYGISGMGVEFMKSYLFSVLYMFGAISLIFFLSSLLKRSITSTLLGFFSLMMILPITESVLKMVDIEPWFLISYYDGFITELLGVVQTSDFRNGGPFASSASFSPDFYTGIYVLLGYTIILFIISLYFVNKRRME
ncbi:MAG: ABC transporter permease [Candidatus Natronoplasma sp.]